MVFDIMLLIVIIFQVEMSNVSKCLLAHWP